ncbi:uncharacterized protein LOC130785075 isoform X2 [Actinidia eriantha]|nr:uncharacterized protein LOC130785075 isoform X2 [Actinidia eriantha]
MLSLQQKSSQAQNVDGEVMLLQTRLSEGETEINRLKELVEKERMNAESERKKAEAEKKEAVKARKIVEAAKSGADEEKRLADLERRKSEENRVLLDKLKSEADEARAILTLEVKVEEANKKHEAESSQAQNVDGEVMLLQTRLSEGETKINRLKELLEKERMNAESERKKAEAEKKEVIKARKNVEAEKSMADEERRLADLERKKSEENRILLDKLKSEADEARTKLTLEVFKVEEANKKLEAERKKATKEKKRADSATAKAEEQRNLAEVNQKNAIEEKCRADNLSQQLEEHTQRIEKLQKEMDEIVSSQKLVKAPADLSDKQMKDKNAELKVGLPLEMLKREIDESKLVLEDLKSEKINKRLKEEKQKVAREKKRADSEMRKAEEHRKVAEVNKQKATEEKHRADQLAQLLEDDRLRMEELQKEILKLASSKTLFQAPAVSPDKPETANMKLLKEKLKLKKKQLKHAKEIVKLEIGRNKILQQELHRLKKECVQFSHHLGMLSKYFLCCSEGRDDLEKTDTPSLNLKGGHFSKEPHQPHLHRGNELVRPGCRALEASDYAKQTMECTAPLLPFTGGNYTHGISGIDSKMEPLLRGSNRKILQSSAINSSTSSFSDRPLMGSQERRDFSVTTSATVAEKKTKSQSNISNLSGEVTKTRDNENLSVRGRKAGDSKKRRILNAVKSIEHIYSEDKNWHLRMEEKLSMLYGMLNSQMGKSLQQESCMLSNLECSPDAEQAKAHKKRKVCHEEAALHHLCGSDELNDVEGTRGADKANLCTQAFLCSNELRGTVQACKDGIGDCGRSIRENFGSSEELMKGNYMKLLDLDNAIDEECYRRAIQVPLSPNLPMIEFQSSETLEIDNTNCTVDESSYEGFSSGKANHMRSCNFDIVNVEIDYSKLKSGTSEASQVPPLNKNDGTIDPLENVANNGNGQCNTVYENNTCGHRMWTKSAELRISDLYSSGYKGTNTLCQSTLVHASDDIPRYYVVFSDTKDSSSISRIFRATGICISQCSMIDRTNLVVQKILPALSKIEDLLPKEKACVFFSVLLHIFSHVLEKSGNFLKMDSVLQLDSLSGCMHTVISDGQTRSMLADLCVSGELLTLIESFLIDRRILVCGNVSSESFPLCGSRINILLNEEDITWSNKMASAHQVVAGSILLAALCASINHIGFLCEASYNIFRMQELCSSLVLTILHVFAHVCGSKYLSHKDYSMVMTVMKSLVAFLENASLSNDSTTYRPSTSEVWPEFPKCTKCPFSGDAVSVDIVVSLLLQKLQNYALAATIHQDPKESANSLNSQLLSSNEKTENTVGHKGEFQPSNCSASCCLIKFDMLTSELNSVCDGNFCHFSDIISLMELVACNMSWDWTCKNIMSQLFKLLESGVQDTFFAATVILLGKLGRLGVDASGYEDNCVENLRSCLSAFLCQNSSRKLGLPAQIGTVNALLALLNLNFEELINSSVELPAVVSPSNPADCIREWYSIMSYEQQSLAFNLLQSVSACSFRPR